jgi:hypothetical protein
MIDPCRLKINFYPWARVGVLFFSKFRYDQVLGKNWDDKVSLYRLLLY